MSSQPPLKIAFIHFAKAAGRYINHYLRQRVLDSDGEELATHGYKSFNSWNTPFVLNRDWSEGELLRLANNRHHRQFPTPEEVRTHHGRWQHDYLARQYVHNHHYNWSRRTLEEFRRNDWFSFMFIRDPADLLCSVWSWAREESQRCGRPVFEPRRLIPLPLDEFVREIIETPNRHGIYALPDYTDLIGFVAGFSEKNFRRLVRIIAPAHHYRPGLVDKQFRYASGNLGYAEYRRRGLISDATHGLLEADEDVGRVRQAIESGDRWSV